LKVGKLNQYDSFVASLNGHGRKKIKQHALGMWLSEEKKWKFREQRCQWHK